MLLIDSEIFDQATLFIEQNEEFLNFLWKLSGKLDEVSQIVFALVLFVLCEAKIKACESVARG